MLWTSPLSAAFLFLLLLPFFPGQNGEEFPEWSTDIISVWEGDSIDITCSVNSSEGELGMYLRTRQPPANVAFFSKSNTPYIHPDLANRITYLKEETNLIITLHDVQKSDSNIYQCIRYIKTNDRHSKLTEKSTTVIVKAKVHVVVEQSPPYISAQEGKSINITCALNSSHEDEEIILLKMHIQRKRVLYVSSQNAPTIFPAFANRLEYSKQEKKLEVTLHNLQKNDTDIYLCAAVLKNSSLFISSDRGTMVLVQGGEQTECCDSSWDIYGLIIVVVLLFSALICCVFYRVNMKKYFQKRKPNVVYEDMSYSSRRNTLVRTNTYTNDK